MTKRITQKQLQEVVASVTKKLLQEMNTGSGIYSAMRSIEHLGADTCMEFENSIISALKLTPPDNLPPELQQKYHIVVTEMQQKVVSAFKEAATKLSHFPKAESPKG